MKKQILLLATGGTIAAQSGIDGLVPAISGARILQSMSGLAEYYEITARDILDLDSSNIQPEEWQLIAGEIYEARQKYDGIVVTHGTDTMGYTSSILSFMLPDIEIPVVLTGSQLPLLHPLTDALGNLRCAFAMAASSVPGIFVAFDYKVILGTRAVKVRTTGFQAFESVNSPFAATIDATGLVLNRSIIPSLSPSAASGGTRPCILRDQLSTDVFLIKLTPGFSPDIFDMLLNRHYRGIVIEAFGSGGLHFIHRDLISRLQEIVEQGIAVVICSQCLYERSDLTVYQPGRKTLEKGIIQGIDMTTEAAVTKLMWCLGQASDLQEIRRLFAVSLAGEIQTEG